MGAGDFAVMDVNRNIVAEFYADIRHGREQARDEAKANATLFAGAGDLLAALMALQKAGGIWPDLQQQVDSAIAKATGSAA